MMLWRRLRTQHRKTNQDNDYATGNLKSSSTDAKKLQKIISNPRRQQ